MVVWFSCCGLWCQSTYFALNANCLSLGHTQASLEVRLLCLGLLLSLPLVLPLPPENIIKKYIPINKQLELWINIFPGNSGGILRKESKNYITVKIIRQNRYVLSTYISTNTNIRALLITSERGQRKVMCWGHSRHGACCSTSWPASQISILSGQIVTQ